MGSSHGDISPSGWCKEIQEVLQFALGNTHKIIAAIVSGVFRDALFVLENDSADERWQIYLRLDIALEILLLIQDPNDEERCSYGDHSPYRMQGVI